MVTTKRFSIPIIHLLVDERIQIYFEFRPLKCINTYCNCLVVIFGINLRIESNLVLLPSISIIILYDTKLVKDSTLSSILKNP